ncbi:MAG: hypothetical protein KC646_04565 [Candidatus Cloacimonetes bacterium]|nr:hypothetical protein [Candidatus Cloacimonadota bacterium]
MNHTNLPCLVCHKSDKEIDHHQVCVSCTRKYRIVDFSKKLLFALSEAVISVRTTYSCPQCRINKRFIHFCDHHSICNKCQQFVCKDTCGQSADKEFLCHNCTDDIQISSLGGEKTIDRCELCFRSIDSRLNNCDVQSTQCNLCSKTICKLCLVQNNDNADTCFCCYQDLLKKQNENRNIIQKIWKFIFPDFKA